MDREKIEDLSIIRLADLYKEKKLSPVEVTKHFLRRIEKAQHIYNAFITVAGEHALALAKESEKRFMEGRERSVLEGIPYAAKDNIYTKGILTTMGCDIFKNFVPDFNAAVIDIMEESGAVLLGKANLQQFASGTSGDGSYNGAVRNPWNTNKSAGGSSSGSAAAIAAGLCPITLGTDTGGSIRIPPSCCGVVGMKPTYSRVSTYGVYPLSWSFDHVGPISRGVKDNALFLNILAGYDPRDKNSLNIEVGDYTSALEKSIKGSVVGVPYSYFDDVEQCVKEAVLKAVQRFEEMGAVIKEIELPDLKAYETAHTTIVQSEAFVIHEDNLRDNPDLINPEVLERFIAGNTASIEYIKSVNMKVQFKELLRKAMDGVHVLALPAMPVVPRDIGTATVELNGISYPVQPLYKQFTWQFNYSGLPALSMPCGSCGGLPIGLQIVGHEWDEYNVYRFANQLELALL